MAGAGASRGHGSPFDHLAQQYDDWFDSAEGRAVFRIETACLRELMPPEGGSWLEVGVGTGRFAEALGVINGLDPSPAMLEIAARRGVETTLGHAEALPYPDAVFDGVLMIVTLCFVNDPATAMTECGRVLKSDSALIAGIIPADSPWGRLYSRRAREGHPFYSAARFHTCDQVIQTANSAGFDFETANSCLLTPPRQPISTSIQAGVVRYAGFVAMRFRKPMVRRSQSHSEEAET